jgi:hypothetical protein
MKNPFLKEILLSNVNSFLGMLLLSSVALGAGLTIWQTAFGHNPLTTVFAAVVTVEVQN